MVEVATAGVTPQKRATSTDGSEDSHDDMYQEDDLHDEKKFKKPGRKPILTEASTKRTAQNRAAQRAFRERKQQYLKGLEEKVKELTEQQERTERENAQLKQFVDKLKEENVTLKSGGTQFTYENVPSSVDFDQAITDLFESSNVPG
ncbi:DNA-binding transcription factor yap1, partial [Coemansia furcata]